MWRWREVGRFGVCLEMTSIEFVDGFDVVGEGDMRTTEKLSFSNWVRCRNSGGGVCLSVAIGDG